jgi:hypothetical protein
MAEFTIILCRLNMGKTRFLTLNPEMEWSIIRSRISNRNRVLGHMGWVYIQFLWYVGRDIWHKSALVAGFVNR